MDDRDMKPNAEPATQPHASGAAADEHNGKFRPCKNLLAAEGFGFVGAGEMDQWMADFDRGCAEDFAEQLKRESSTSTKRTTTFGFLDIAPYIRSGMQAIKEDSFTQCFVSQPRNYYWMHTWYLAPLYFLGVVIRYFFLLPLRLTIVVFGMSYFATLLLIGMVVGPSVRRRMLEHGIRVVNGAFLMAFCAIIRHHGPLPEREPGQIFVANHTTVIDICVLLHRRLFALTGQEHVGVIGFFQKYVLDVMNNLWFNRMESKDRHKVAQKIRELAADVTKHPLLVFPEGTCVNNEYVVMFKRGAFEIAHSIVPVAIKYNKTFVDAFWNSKQQDFPSHLLMFFTSWALIVDVHWMEPQYRMRDETSTQFASRIKEMIAKEAGLNSVPWDGYLKYFRPKPEFKKHRQEIYTKILLSRFKDMLDEEDKKEKVKNRLEAVTEGVSVSDVARSTKQGLHLTTSRGVRRRTRSEVLLST